MYIHIPFCIQKCPYCDFYSITDLSLADSFLSALLKDMATAQPGEIIFDTVYFGGGTPSVLNGQDVSIILETVHRYFNVQAHSEVTIEVNPGTAGVEKLKQYKRSGINRLNIGVQSFDDSALRFLGRIHSGRQAEMVIHLAREAGFDNIGLDLIYGLPTHDKDRWRNDLQRAIDFAPTHLSCYMLTYEKNTGMWEKMKKKVFAPLPDKKAGELFNMTIQFLTDHGYTQYEISNFAKGTSGNFRENASRHNQKYWSADPYLGFGPAAHSFVKPKRFWNVRSVQEYIDLLSRGDSPIGNEEILSTEQLMIEAVYLGLRKTEGIDIGAYNAIFNTSFTRQFHEVIKELENNGWICIDTHRCALSRKGMLFLESIAQMFVDKIP